MAAHVSHHARNPCFHPNLHVVICPRSKCARIQCCVFLSFRVTSSSLALLRGAESLELDPSLLQIVVDNDSVVDTGSLGVSDLILSLLQTSQNGFLTVRGAAAKPLLQDLDRRRLQEEEAGVEVGLLDLLDALEIRKH